ncbi:MAG: TetR family transcriptional regulator [Oceanospirillaceae bacterium]|nr:TetR family transcriptional regulator [Oceanospirillaceae bacterium]MBT14100.1 TetR family transcriptional regulator [Oceanospirillaceae bacterium]|tara:strand:- start:34920 stop:35654 length:735 start_codon:yes stop_codon:yes gene_type:complete
MNTSTDSHKTRTGTRPQGQKSSTRERILAASLSLFNEQGERSVSTNHIAAHLQISPGNLYYHFKNKQAIIFALFEQYQQRVLGILEIPAGRTLQPQDKLHYLQGVFKGLWDYRFLHRDMEHLLLADPELHRHYRDFFRTCQSRVEAIFRGLGAAGILNVSEDDISGLALNTWIIVTSWFSFLRCNLLSDEAGTISPELLQGGIYQVFTLERPYLTDEYRDEMIALQQRYMPRPSWLVHDPAGGE